MATTVDAIIQTGTQFNSEIAEASWRWSTMSDPRKRAEQDRQDYLAHMHATYAALTPDQITPEQEQALTAWLAEYREGYLSRLHAALSAKSRTASWTVTGRANFNVSRNQKRLDTESRRWQELTDWSEYQQRQIKKQLAAMATPDQVTSAEVSKARQRIGSYIKSICAIDTGEGRAWMTRAGYGRAIAATIASVNTTEARHQLIQEIHAAQTKLPGGPILTKRHAIYRDWLAQAAPMA